MHHKTQSIVTIGIVLAIMFSVAILINSMEGPTGAVVKDCECQNNLECNDNNPCTEDLCLYPESCAASKCINKEIENCYN
jgi:hypothetical protein